MHLKICAVTGSRADWSLLSVALQSIGRDPDFEVVLAVTGQHLAPGPDGSVRDIEADGFTIDAKVETLLASDGSASTAKAMGLGLIGFADALERLCPDLLIVLGDRYEVLAAVGAALVARLPVAHLCGGDVTEGAMDEAIRHSITKMSHLHFVTNDESARRVRQLGEDPRRIHVVGSTGLDRIRLTPVLEQKAFFDAIGFTPRRRNLLVTFHPVTLGEDSSAQCDALLAALDRLGSDTGLIFTGANSDPGHLDIMRKVESFVAGRKNALLRPHLGPKLYYSAMEHVDAVVGNSSSGVYEAPSFKVPTVNIGDRQKGRLRAASVIDCAPTESAIHTAIAQAYDLDCSAVANPYGDGRASERIVAVLKGLTDPRSLLKKAFFDV